MAAGSAQRLSWKEFSKLLTAPDTIIDFRLRPSSRHGYPTMQGVVMSLKVFVAGGTGVLGRASLPALVEAGHSVRSTARGSNKAALVRSLGAEPVECDLYDLASARKAVAGCDVLIRLTTKIGSMTKIRDHKMWNETNRLRTQGARVLVDAAIQEGVPTYIHECVTFVYADGGTRWLTEEARTDAGHGAILHAALEGEQEAARLTEEGGKGIVLRFGGFYGADAPSTPETFEMARRRMLAQIGPGTNYFSSIYVPDAGRAVAAVIDAPAGIYNVCDDEPVLFREYLQAVANAAGAKKPLHLPAFLGRLIFGQVWEYFSRSQRVSNAKLKRETGWEPQVASAAKGWEAVAAELERKAKQPTQRKVA
jgi:nucleoside-diphosphate-sugar epimerase